MKNKTKHILTGIYALSLFGTASAAIATNVELVTDGAFANAATTPTLDNWFEENDDGASSGNLAFAEVQQDDGASSVPNTADGNWLNLATRTETSLSAAVYQDLGVWNTGDALTFNASALLGDRDNQGFGTITFELWASDTGTTGADGTALSALTGASLLDSSSAFDIVESGASTLATGTFSLDATGVADTDIVWIRIAAAGADDNQHLVDNVSVTAIPEPGTLALVGLALGALMILRRRR